MKDIKVIPSEECVPQHKLLVCDLNVKAPAFQSKPFTPKCRIWKLRKPQAQAEFEQVFAEELNGDPVAAESIEGIWTKLKRSLLSVADKVCGQTSSRHLKRETWWWDDDVNSAISEKRCWKAWKEGGSKEEYLHAKRLAKRSVYAAKRQAEANRFANLRSGKSDIFKIAKQMRRENQDVVGDKCVKDDSGNLSLDDNSKKVAWKQHYQCLLNEEFPWNPDDLSAV